MANQGTVDVPYVRAVDLFAVRVQGLWDPDDTSEIDLLEAVIEEMDDDPHRQAMYLELVNNRWNSARDEYNHGHGLLPADRAPVGIPYRALLRPSDEGGLPNRMPISGSFSAALFFLRRMLEAIHPGWEDDVDDQDGSDGDGGGLYGQQQQHGGGDGIEHGSDNDENHDDDSATHGGSGQSSPGTVSTPSVRKAAPKAPKRAREAAAKGKVVIPDGSRLEPGSNMTILQAVDDRREGRAGQGKKLPSAKSGSNFNGKPGKFARALIMQALSELATVPVENRTQFSYDLAVDTAFEVLQDISRNNRIPDFAPDLSDHARTNFWNKVLSRWLPPHLPQNAVDTAPDFDLTMDLAPEKILKWVDHYATLCHPWRMAVQSTTTNPPSKRRVLYMPPGLAAAPGVGEKTVKRARTMMEQIEDTAAASKEQRSQQFKELTELTGEMSNRMSQTSTNNATMLCSALDRMMNEFHSQSILLSATLALPLRELRPAEQQRELSEYANRVENSGIFHKFAQ